jgi:hypothetical protein
MDVVSIRDVEGRSSRAEYAAFGSEERNEQGKKAAAGVLFTQEKYCAAEAAQ